MSHQVNEDSAPDPISRREALRATAFLSVGTLLGIRPGRPTSEGNGPRLDGDPLLDMLQAAREASKAAKAFSTGASAGLFYVTRPTASGASEVATQMAPLLSALTRLQSSFSSLPPTLQEGLTIQFPVDRYRDLVEAARRYCAHSEAAASDERKWGDPVVRDDLRRIRGVVSEKREALMTTPEGLGPEAALLLPLAVAAELGSAARIEPDRERVRALLDSYDGWINRMDSHSAGSVASRLEQAAIAHDGALNQVAETDLGRRLGIERLKLSADSDGVEYKRVADPCVLFSKGALMFPPLDRRGGLVLPQDYDEPHVLIWSTNFILSYSKILVRSNRDLGIRLIKLIIDPYGVYSAPHYMLRPGIGGEYVYIMRSERVLSGDEVRARSLTHPSVKEDNEARGRILTTISRANAARSAISLCGDAPLIFKGVRGKLGYHRNQYAG